MELLTPGVGLIFWQTVIFLLLVALLARVAWKPILKALKERESFIQESLDSAEKTNREMAAMKADNENLLKAAREERTKILRTAREAAARIHDQAHTEAKKSADEMIASARASIDMEKRAALEDIRVQVATLSLEIAEKLMKKNLSEDSAQKELVKRFLDELKSN